MNQSDLSRSQCKSPEGAVAYRLDNEVGLSPVQIRAVIDIFVEHQLAYWRNDRAPGDVVYPAVAKGQPAGRPIKDCKLVPVRLSLFVDSDCGVLEKDGSVALRGVRIVRLTNEAFTQGGLLSFLDLANLLGVDVSTIGGHVRKLRNAGFVVPNRGFVEDIGPDPSHKRLIARLLGQGHTTSYIRSVTLHSEGSIGRYQRQFAMVLYLLHAYPETSDEQRRQISGLDPNRWAIYVDVYNDLVQHPEYQPHLERLRRRHELDPENLSAQIPPGKRPEDSAQKRLEEQTLENAIRQTIQEDMGSTRRIAQAVTDDILKLVDAAFPVSDSLRPGEIVAFVDKHDPSFISGEKVLDRPVIPVVLPLYTDQAFEIWHSDQPVGVRRAHIATLVASAAAEQGGVFSVAGLADLLHVQPSTMAKDLRDLAVTTHMQAPTKGLLEDAGATLTHKEWIVDLDQHGLTAEEISWLTRHAPMSRDRYIATFRRAEALMRVEGAIPDSQHLACVLRILPWVAKQYVDLLHRYYGVAPSPPKEATTETA
jgi:hypothetical protein